jgi:flagellar assembly factor FliW
VQLQTTRFGLVETETQRQVHFPAGLPGFPGIQDYVMLDSRLPVPWKWLQAITAPDVAFVIIDPTLLWPEYCVEITEDILRELQARETQQLAVFVILTIAPPAGIIEKRAITANLQAPLVINQDTHCGKQLILVRGAYHTRHPLPEPAV